MITHIDPKEETLIVYEANVEIRAGRKGIKRTEYTSYKDFVEHYGDNSGIVSITICCNPYQVLQFNGTLTNPNFIVEQTKEEP